MKKQDHQIRTFLAMELPEDVQIFLGGISNDLKKTGADVKWVTPSNIHLTLKFIGDTAPQKIPLIQSHLEKAFLSEQPLELEVQGLGVFPSYRRPRVVWAGVQDKLGILAQAAKKVDRSLVVLGFQPEQRPFKAHLTLGRVRSNHGDQPLADAVRKMESIPGPAFVAHHVTLFKSTLKPSGAEYLPLFRVNFASKTCL